MEKTKLFETIFNCSIDEINIGHSLVVSIFSMAVVFFVLLMISYVIKLTAKVIPPEKAQPAGKSVSPKGASADDAETIAVITAAVAAYEGSGDFQIKSVKDADSSWANSSRANSVK